MATLNTLRTKGGVFLSIIIGISLLAFLLGDLASSGNSIFNTSRMRIGEINGNNISYQEYDARVNDLTIVQEIVAGSSSRSDQDNEIIRNQAWEQILREYTFDSSLDKLGLIIGEEETIDMATGQFTSPILSTIFVDRTTGGLDREMMQNYVANLDADQSGRSRFFWGYIEQEMARERGMSKFMELVEKGMFVNNLEIEDGVVNANVDADIRFVARPIASLVDSTLKATDAEIKEYYRLHKEQYKQEASRNVEYVVYDILPSQLDYMAASEEVNRIAQEFKATEDVKQFVNLNSEEPFNGAYLKASEMPDTIAKFAFSAKKEDVMSPLFESDVYTLARVVDVKNLPDSIEARQILLSPQNQKLADSLVTVLKANKAANFEELAGTYSLDKENIEMGRFNPSKMINEEFSNSMSNANVGDVLSLKSPYGLHVVEITYKGSVVPKAQVALVKYTVEPSEETRQTIFTAANDFATKAASNGAASLNDKASESNVFVRVANLKGSDNGIQGIENSREALRWAFGASNNEVSGVITTLKANVVVRLSGIVDHGYATVESVKPEITANIIRDKRLNMIAEQMKGASSLDDLASKNNLTVKDATGINFDSFYIPDLGVAPTVVGAVSSLEPAVVSKPIITDSDVVVVDVTNKKDGASISAEQVKVFLQTNNQTQIQSRVYNAVYQNAEIRDNRVKFY